MFSVASVAASNHSGVISGLVAQSSGESSQPVREHAEQTGIELPLESLRLALQDEEKIIKELKVRQAKNTVLENACTSLLSFVDMFTTGMVAAETDSGGGPTISKTIMWVNDTFRLGLSVINLFRAKDNENPLPHSDDTYSYSAYNLAISAGCSEATAKRIANYLGNALTALTTFVGTFATLDDQRAADPALKNIAANVTYGTAGAKAAAVVVKSITQQIKNNLAKHETERDRLTDEINQRERKLREVDKASMETQITIETQEQSGDTEDLITVSDAGTNTEIKTETVRRKSLP